MLRTDALTVRLGEHPLLQGVDLQLSAGTWHGLLGPNGSGKTTLMRAALGLLGPTSGRVELLGAAPPAPSGLVGVSFGPRLLHPSRRAGTELLLRVAAAGGSRDAARRAWDETGLVDPRVPCGVLSLGQAQRLSVVAALATSPRLLVLDEPTVGLDLASLAWLRERLHRYTADGGCAWVSSHDLAEVERSADAITVLERGEVAFSGSLSALVGPSSVVRLRSSDPGMLHEALLRAGTAHTRLADGGVRVMAASCHDLGRMLADGRVPLLEMVEERSTLESSVRGLVGTLEPSAALR